MTSALFTSQLTATPFRCYQSRKAKTNVNRKKQIYSTIPKDYAFKRNDPFNYKLRSLAEVQEQMKYFPPDIIVQAIYRKYTAGDTREGHENNTDDRDRVSKIKFNLLHLNLQPL